MKQELERKKANKGRDLLDEDLLARTSRMNNNRLKSHEFRESGTSTSFSHFIYREIIHNKTIKQEIIRQTNGNITWKISNYNIYLYK